MGPDRSLDDRDAPAHRLASAFVDTSGWYALIDRRDAAHARAASEIKRLITAGSRLVTTDYVIDESCTLARFRSGSAAASRLLDVLEQTAALDVEWIGADRFDLARTLFRKHLDQGFSFTDCTSFVVMQERGIVEAVTTDTHFRVRGFRPLLGDGGSDPSVLSARFLAGREPPSLP